MEWGSKVEMLESIKAAGGEVPALNKRPDIDGFEWLWEAFHQLNTCRVSGMGIGPIPWSAVEHYVEVEKFTPFEKLLLHRSIRSMDNAFIKYHAEKRPRNGTSKKNNR